MSEEMVPTGTGYRYEPTLSDLVPTSHKATVVGVLPYRQTWTRCAPCVEYLGVRTGVGADPFEEIEDQGVNRVEHRAHRNAGNRSAVYSTWIVEMRIE